MPTLFPLLLKFSFITKTKGVVTQPDTSINCLRYKVKYLPLWHSRPSWFENTNKDRFECRINSHASKIISCCTYTEWATWLITRFSVNFFLATERASGGVCKRVHRTQKINPLAGLRWTADQLKSFSMYLNWLKYHLSKCYDYLNLTTW